MSASSATTAPQSLFDNATVRSLQAGLDRLGFGILRVEETAFAGIVSYVKNGAAARVNLSIEQADETPGLADIVSVLVLELDARGNATGAKHRFEYVKPGTVEAVSAFIEAVAS